MIREELYEIDNENHNNYGNVENDEIFQKKNHERNSIKIN